MSTFLTPYSNSTFYVTTGLIFSNDFSTDRLTVIEVSGFKSEMIDSDTWIRMLIVWKIPKCAINFQHFNIQNHVCPLIDFDSLYLDVNEKTLHF